MTERLAILGLFATMAAALSAQTPTFSTHREAVRVDVLVTDGGRPVPGLRASDFELLDEGVPQRVDLVASEKVPLNVMLAFDLSRSVSGERLDDLRRAGHAVLDAFQPGDAGALLTFTHVVTIQQELTQDAGHLRDALDRGVPSGRTALIDAVYAAIVLGESDPGRDLVLVFSDAEDTSSWLPAERVLEAARRSDVTVYAVSTGRERGFLGDLSSQTGGRRIALSSTAGLARTFVEILEEFRQRYLLSYSPAGVSKEGWHRLTVRVKGRRLNITARSGYVASPRTR